MQAGDCIWMAPFVIQWYAALGKTRSRYIINKVCADDSEMPACVCVRACRHTFLVFPEWRVTAPGCCLAPGVQDTNRDPMQR